MQLTAILLPADTPVTNGRELPLNVQWGSVLAASDASVGAVGDVVAAPEAGAFTSAAAPQDNVITDTIRMTLTKKTLVERTSTEASPLGLFTVFHL